MKLKAMVKVIMLMVVLTNNTYAKSRFERSFDTLTVNTCNTKVDSIMDIWAHKMNGKLLQNNCPGCDTLPPFYSSGILRTSLFVRKDSCIGNKSHLTLIHVWHKGDRKQALYRIPNVTSTIKQEFGIDDEGATDFKRKSYLTYAGLTLINTGLGLAYGSHESPFYYYHPAFIGLYGIMDLALTIGMFIPDEKISKYSMGFLPLNKAMVLFHLILVKEHNKLGKTGYKFKIKG